MSLKRVLSFGSVVRATSNVHLARGRWIDVSGSRRYPMPTPAPPLLASELVTMPDASCYERTRDSMLRGLQHKLWTYLAIVWLVVLCIDFLFYACTLLGLHTIRSESKAQWWNNAAVKLLSALFTYVCMIALPWRVANAAHLFSARSERGKPGVDFYGRPTEDIWFHIPRGPRATLVLLLWGNASIQVRRAPHPAPTPSSVGPESCVVARCAELPAPSPARVLCSADHPSDDAHRVEHVRRRRQAVRLRRRHHLRHLHAAS